MTDEPQKVEPTMHSHKGPCEACDVQEELIEQAYESWGADKKAWVLKEASLLATIASDRKRIAELERVGDAMAFSLNSFVATEWRKLREGV